MRGLRPSRAALALNLALATFALLLAVGVPGSTAAPGLRLASADGSLTIANSQQDTASSAPRRCAPGRRRAARCGSRTPARSRVRCGWRSRRPRPRSRAPAAAGCSARLELRVVDVTDAQAPATVYAGRLGAMPAVALRSLAPGQQRAFLFVAGLPPAGASDNAYQGAQLAAGFTWTATGAEPPTPTPYATPAPSAQPPATQPPVTGSPPSGSGPVPGTPAADPTGAVLGAQVFRLPNAGRCVSRRKFPIRIRRPKGLAFKSLIVSINRRTKIKLTGLKARRVKATINLRGLPKGKVVVKVAAVTTTGRKAVSKRTYRTCAAKPKRR